MKKIHDNISKWLIVFTIILMGTSLFGASTIKVFIDLDSWEDETSWTLKDPSGTTVASGGVNYGDSYGDSDEYIVVDTAVTTAGTYVFEIEDSFGDGISTPNGNGSNDSDADNQAMYEVSVDGRVIFRSEEYPNFGSSYTVNIDITDLDGDHVADESDPDTDGDGILDYDEEGAASVAQTGTWADNTVSASAGNTDISMVSVPDSGVSDWTYDTTDTFNSNNGADLWSTPGLTGDDSLTFTFGANMDITAGTTRKMTLYFSEPQTDVVVHFDRIGGFDNNGDANSAVFTLTDADVSLTRLSGNTQFIADSGTKEIYRDTQYTCDNAESDNATNYTAAGSVEFKSTTPFTKLSFDVGFTGVDGGDAVEIIIEADSYAVLDTDNDNIDDKLDLDSDNDGIPDNVEAQSTSGFTPPSGTDTDGDGIDDAYDTDDGGTPVPLPDTDRDGTRDTLDTDSDNDGYTDCEEGNNNAPSNGCPVTSVEANGLVSWAGGGADYTDVNGNVDDPTTDLINETGDTSEVAYREFLCGKALITLTAYNWRMISVSCDTGSNTIQDLFGNSLGTYGEPEDGGHWVMYKQTGTTDNYETNSSHPNTDKSKLDENSTLVQGISYWIITDADHNVTIDETLSDISPTTTQDANSTGVNITDPDFTKVAIMQLPNNIMNVAGDAKKYMAGNPFPYSFHVGNLYFKHYTGNSNTYYPMGDTNNNDYIRSVVYTHDSTDTGPVTGYTAIDPSTPGFGGSIQPMEGFFIKLLEENTDNGINSFAFPLIMSNQP